MNQADVDRENLERCEAQRNLSDVGRAQAVGIGEAFRRLGTPVGTVLASPYCRTMETAQLAFGRAEASAELVSQLSDGDAGGRERLTAALLARPPDAGSNAVLVSHWLNIEDATGLDIGEGEAVVALPDGAGGSPLSRVSNPTGGVCSTARSDGSQPIPGVEGLTPGRMILALAPIR